MKLPDRRVVLELAWIALPVVLPLLLGGVVLHLSGLKGRVNELEQQIERKRAELAAINVPDEERHTLTERLERLAEWERMITSDSQRIEELSRIAWKNGVALRSLRSSAPTTSPDGSVVSCAHQVSALGTYRQLAAFLDEIYQARGLAGIEQLEIQPDGPPGSNLLLAALGVRWYAKGNAPAAQEAAQ